MVNEVEFPFSDLAVPEVSEAMAPPFIARGGIERKILPLAQLGAITRKLRAMFNAYEKTIGNDAVRDWLMAALAFAISRHCGLTGEYETGLNFVDRALAFGDRPNEHRYVRLHLEACRHVLDLKQRGQQMLTSPIGLICMLV
jgi:hypothetical protein